MEATVSKSLLNSLRVIGIRHAHPATGLLDKLHHNSGKFNLSQRLSSDVSGFRYSPSVIPFFLIAIPVKHSWTIRLAYSVVL